MVWEIVAWPSISWTTLGLTFLEQSKVAQVCLRSWKRTVWGRLAFLSSGLKERLKTLWRLRDVPSFFGYCPNRCDEHSRR
jgi:hypothetical protein